MLADFTLIADFVAAFCTVLYIAKLLRDGVQVEEDVKCWGKLSLQTQRVFKKRVYNTIA